MAYSIITPENSFVRFDGWEPEDHCIFGRAGFCLPVYASTDIAFQFIVLADTAEEASDLCQVGASGIEIGLVRDCDQADFDIEFTELPERAKLSDLQVLYNFTQGFDGFEGSYEINDCFYFRIRIDGINYCSNCFQRIGNDCFTSVLEYGNDENAFGFNYCSSGEVAIADEVTCQPYIVEFVDKETLTIPYTSFLQAKFGSVPTVQAWIYDGSELVNTGISITLIGTPVSSIFLDFGGLASGFVKIR